MERRSKFRVVRHGLRHLKFSYVLFREIQAPHVKPRVLSQASRCEVCGSTKWHCDKFYSHYVGFSPPCQYLSINAVYFVNRGYCLQRDKWAKPGHRPTRVVLLLKSGGIKREKGVIYLFIYVFIPRVTRS